MKKRQKRPPKIFDPLFYEKDLWGKGVRFIAGIDEAGRGPWAGPVVAGAVILPENCCISGLKDSKALSPKKREEFSVIIKEKAIAYGIGIIESEEIDNLNILQATFMAMKKALEKFPSRPQFLLVDGNRRIPGIDIPQLALVKGDSLSLSIQAASVLAKVTRDEIMQRLDKEFPCYGFSRHKGYGTREHEKKLKKFGPTQLHRFSFKPVEKTSKNFAKKQLGKWGEERAARFLKDHGYKILSQNVRTRLGEIDILAEDSGRVVFIEVKTRTSDRFGRGEESISLHKQRRLVKLALQIMKSRKLIGRDFRFDVLSIDRDKGKEWRVKLIKNAFNA